MSRLYEFDRGLSTETRYREMIRLINEYCDPRGKRLVDLGAGPNPISRHVASRSTTTIDFDPKRHPDIVCNINEESVPLPDDSCDILIAGEVLEHVYFSVRFLNEIKRLLVSGGYLILSVPNVSYLPYRVLWLWWRVPPFAAKADCTYHPYGRPGGHVRDYNFRELETLLRRLDFEVVKSTTNGIVYGKFRLPRMLIPKTWGQKAIVLARNRK